VSTGSEAPAVTIARLICQLVLSVGVLSVCVWAALTHPELQPVVGLVGGLVLGFWFGAVREPHPR
jgi:hypothetical protein